MVEVFANSEDPDQTPRSAASDLGLYCLPNTLLGVSRLQWVNSDGTPFKYIFVPHGILISGTSLLSEMQISTKL